MNHAHNPLLCVAQSGKLHLDLISVAGHKMCQQNDGLDQVRLCNIRPPIGVHSQWFGLDNAVDSQFDCLGKSPHGPWLAANQSPDRCEWLARIGNMCDSVHAMAHHNQLNIQFLLDPSLFLCTKPKWHQLIDINSDFRFMLLLLLNDFWVVINWNMEIQTETSLKLATRCSSCITTLQSRNEIKKNNCKTKENTKSAMNRKTGISISLFRHWKNVNKIQHTLQFYQVFVHTMWAPKLWPTQFNDRKSNFSAYSIRCSW